MPGTASVSFSLQPFVSCTSKDRFPPILADAAVEIDAAIGFKAVFRNTSSFSFGGVECTLEHQSKWDRSKTHLQKHMSRRGAEHIFKVSYFSFGVIRGESQRYGHPVLKAPPAPSPDAVHFFAPRCLPSLLAIAVDTCLRQMPLRP